MELEISATSFRPRQITNNFCHDLPSSRRYLLGNHGYLRWNRRRSWLDSDHISSSRCLSTASPASKCKRFPKGTPVPDWGEFEIDIFHRHHSSGSNCRYIDHSVVWNPHSSSLKIDRKMGVMTNKPCTARTNGKSQIIRLEWNDVAETWNADCGQEKCADGNLKCCFA